MGDAGEQTSGVMQGQVLLVRLLQLLQRDDGSADEVGRLLVPDLNHNIAGVAEELVGGTEASVREGGRQGDLGAVLRHSDVAGVRQLGVIDGQLAEWWK